MNSATCDGSGGCVIDMGLKHFGGACSTSAQCFNGVCRAGLCKLAPGDPCVDDVTCDSQRCAGGVCTACGTDGDCATASCSMGVCALPPGAPCAMDTDCTAGCGALGYCGPTSMGCSLVTCPFHACPQQICQSCNTSSDCYMNTPCTGGQCLAPPGTFCTPGGLVQCSGGPCPAADFLDFSKCK